jgi:hypothetical protein
MAEEVYVKAMEVGQFSAAVAAIRELGVLTGLRIERRENGAPFEFTERTTEELIGELRELGYDVRDLGVPVEGDVPPSQAVN